MAEKPIQNYANHVRFHPPFHFFLLPGAAVLLTVSVRVLVPLVVAGENTAVTPVGRPATESFTVLVKP